MAKACLNAAHQDGSLDYTTSIYHVLQFALQFRKYKDGLIVQLKVEFTSQQGKFSKLTRLDIYL